MREYVLVVLTGLVGIAVSSGPRQTQPQSAPVFHTTTEMVGVDVTVLDKDHRPVHGLTAADFTVFEDGKPQSIVAFAATDFPDAVQPSAPWMRTASVELVTNQVQESRLFVLVLDDSTVELDLASMNSAKRVAKSVVDKLGPADRMAVIFTRDNRHAQDFTNDHQKLVAAVDTFSLGFGGPSAALFMVNTLSEVAHYLGDVPDRRKILVYVGQGISLDLSAVAPLEVMPDGKLTLDSPSLANLVNDLALTEAIRRLFDDAQRANVNIYGLDTCGLRGMQRPDPFQTQAPVGGGGMLPPLVQQTCKTGGFEVEFLRGLARATGGRATVSTSDFNPGIDQIFQENASYYLLGYRRADAQRDGHYHRIQVKVNRPGVEVRARTGYYAENAKGIRPRTATADRGAGLDEAMAGVLPNTDLPMDVSLAPFATADRKGGTVVAIVGISPVRPGAAASTAVTETVDLESSAFTPEGSPRGVSSHQNATLALTTDAEGKAHYEVLAALTLPPGRYSLRFAAHSQAANKMGSVYADVIVPDFGRERVSISGVVLSKTPAPPKASTETLAALLPVTPTSARVFAVTDLVAAFLRVYEGGSDPAAAANVSVRIQDGADKTVFSQSDVLPAATFEAAARAADYQASLPIDRLKVGPYLLSIQVKVGKNTSTREVRFDVK